MVDQGVEADANQLRRRARLRTPGSDTTLEVDVARPSEMRADFEALHRQRFGYVDEDAEPIVDDAGRWRRIARILRRHGEGDQRSWSTSDSLRSGDRPPRAGEDGPALIFEPSSTIVVEPGWQADARGDGTLDPDPRRAAATRATPIGTDVDPVRLEIFNNLFMAIAEEMGVALQSTATSVNIKERLDFSCAIFDATGALIANAPHIPVHLGSMGESIRTIIDSARRAARDGRGIRRGDAYVLNDPYRGGTHLPDITVIVPVFYGDEAAAVRLRRGARPPCRHRRDRAGIDAARQPDDRRRRRADRQCAARRRGPFPRGGDARAARRRRLAGAQPRPQHLRSEGPARRLRARRRGAGAKPRAIMGREVVAAYMGHVLANAEESVRRLLDRLDDGDFAYEMDNGAHVRGADHASTRRRARRPSISPAPATSCPTISTRLFRSSARRRSMSCAP